MSENPNRVPAGVPTGGQFAASAKAEAEVRLATECESGCGICPPDDDDDADLGGVDTPTRQSQESRCANCGEDVVKERADEWFHADTGEEHCADSDDFADPIDDFDDEDEDDEGGLTLFGFERDGRTFEVDYDAEAETFTLYEDRGPELHGTTVHVATNLGSFSYVGDLEAHDEIEAAALRHLGQEAEDDEGEGYVCEHCGNDVSELGVDSTGSRRCDDLDPEHKHHIPVQEDE